MINATALTAASGAEFETREKTILLAEDDPDDAFLFERALRRSGLPHRVTTVWDGQECIDYLLGNAPYDDRAAHPLPDLLILDLNMPLITGREVLAWLATRPEFEGLPVVVLSGSELPRDRQQLMQEAGYTFHEKTSDPAELAGFVKRILEQGPC